ncbi:MAG: ABC transporter ATP-binding protein [Burkholderiales bacterium]|nr:ABC transporter ATP-binding protein [Burkholderiales bacterium]
MRQPVAAPGGVEGGSGAHTAAGLALHGLAAGYPGRAVIRALDLPRVPPGSLVGVLGANAAGKSTLLKAIAGLRPARGRILLDGEDLNACPPRERLRRVGYLPQALPQASSLVAYEAMLAALHASRPELGRARTQALIEAVFASLGLAGIALRPLDELSGGQRQMVGLAQVIARESRLLLLDEPTSALDLRWQLQVLQTVRTLVDRRQAICLMALHDLNLALRFCDRLVVLGPDAVLAAGLPAREVDAGLLHRAYGVQARIERCSHGYPVVLVDRAVDAAASDTDPHP